MGRAVVVNPHDDDGAIALGGTLLRLIARGWKIKFLQLTDGRHGSNVMAPEETKRVRAGEARERDD